jgi:hypothetical protein
MIAKDLVPEMGARSFAIMKARRQREAGGGSGGWCYCLGEADSRFPIQDLSVSRGIRSTITGLTRRIASAVTPVPEEGEKDHRSNRTGTPLQGCSGPR